MTDKFYAPKEELKRVTNGESFDNYKYIWSTKWEDDGKWSLQTAYFIRDGSLFCKHIGKSGSYFTDYYFNSDDWSDNEEIYPVEPSRYYTERMKENSKLLQQIVEFVLSLPDDNDSEVQKYLKSIAI